MTGYPQAFPRKVLSVFCTADEARWFARASSLQGPQIGPRSTSLAAFVNEVGRALWGDPTDTAMLDARLLDVLRTPAFCRAFPKLVEGGRASALIRRSLLNCLEDVHAARFGKQALPTASTPREQTLRALADAWESGLPAPSQGCWSRGHVAEMIAAGAARLPVVRDLAALHVAADVLEIPWASRFLHAVAEGRVTAFQEPDAAVTLQSTTRHESHSPIAEVVAAARMFSGSFHESIAILVPSGEASTWAARLSNLGLPVLAFGSTGATSPAAARLLSSMADLHEGERVPKESVRDLLFSKRLDWRALAISSRERAAAEDLPSEFVVENHWKRQRRATGTLDEWKVRIAAAKEQRPRGEKPGAEEQAALCAELMIERLEAVRRAKSAEPMAELLRSLDFLRRSADVAAEHAVAEKTLAALEQSGSLRFAAVWRDLALEDSSDAHAAWTDTWNETNATGTRVTAWIVPWSAAPERLPGLPKRRILAGLDAFPRVAQDGHWFSVETMRALGFSTAEVKRTCAEARLERVWTSASHAVLSHRTRGSQAEELEPSPWLARLLAAEKGQRGASGTAAVPTLSWSRRSVLAGAKDESLPTGYALTPAEIAPTRDDERESLANRCEAIAAQGSPAVSKWTGLLGLTPPAASHYSVSSLQAFGTNPYRYFLERVLRLSEEGDLGDTLSASEEGKAIHTAFETPMAARFDAQAGAWINVPQNFAAIRRETLEAVETVYGKEQEGLLDPQGREGAVARWQQEVGDFLDGRRAALDDVAKGTPDELVEQSKAYLKARKDLLPLEEFLADPTEANLIATWKAAKKKSTSAEFHDALLAARDPETGMPLMLDRVEELRDKMIKQRKAYPMKVAAWPGDSIAAVEAKLEDGDTPLSLSLGEGHSLPLRGSIDRLEYSSVRNALIIVDYKTGQSAGSLTKDMASGKHLQLPLYAAAAETLAAAGRFGERAKGLAVESVQLAFVKRAGAASKHTIKAINPHDALDGTDLNPIELAKGYALAFRSSIEAGLFPLVNRVDGDFDDGLARAMRFVPKAARGDGSSWSSRNVAPALPLAPEDLPRKSEG